MSDDPFETWTDSGYSEAEARQIIEWLASERRRLKRQPSTRIGAASEKHNLKRRVRNLMQKKAKRLKKSRPHQLPTAFLVSRYRNVPLLNGFLPERQKLWKPIFRRPYPPIPPTVSLKEFSFISNPRGTMEMLRQCILTEGQHIHARLDFLDEECLDIGPYLVLQAIRTHLAPVYTGGRMGVEVQRVIDAVGLRSALQISPFADVRNHDGIWPFHLRQRRPANSSRSAQRQIEPQNKELVADQFVQTVDLWLRFVAKRRFTLEGRRNVQKIVGEALDNAERHSQVGSDDGDWSLTGYLVRKEVNGRLAFRMHIAMLSVGSTIEESILNGPQTMLENMERYVRKHSSGLLSSESLRTVFALQDGVTKDHAAAAEGRGGTGFQEMFRFFEELGSLEVSHVHEMTIISGNTCILLRQPFTCGQRMKGDSSERELWFNDANTQDAPPDRNHVLGLPHRLHGTLISMAIPLDTEFLEETSNDHDQS